MCSDWPMPPWPWRSDSPSQAIAAYTSLPARACSATVPPHPNTSSSGWAAITRTRLGECVLIGIGPHPSGPQLIAQVPAPQDRAVFLRQLEQHDHALAAVFLLAAGDHLPACLWDGAYERTQHGPGLDGRRGAVAAQEERGLPHGPAGPVEPAEGPGVGPRERANEVVYLAAGPGPVDHAVGGAAARELRVLARGLGPAGPLTREQPRHEAPQHVAIGRGDLVVERRDGVVRRDAEGDLVDHGAPIHALGEPDERVAGLGLALDQRPIHRGAAAVARQVRRVRADHADAGEPQRGRPDDLAPADHERDVGLDGAERGEAVRAVDGGDFVQRHAVASAQRAVVDRTGAARPPLGRERDDAVNRCPGLHEGLERGTALGVESDPGEAERFHRRFTRTTSRTAAITSLTSSSVSRGLSGRLSSRP